MRCLSVFVLDICTSIEDIYANVVCIHRGKKRKHKGAWVCAPVRAGVYTFTHRPPPGGDHSPQGQEGLSQAVKRVLPCWPLSPFGTSAPVPPPALPPLSHLVDAGRAGSQRPVQIHSLVSTLIFLWQSADSLLIPAARIPAESNPNILGWSPE